MTEKEWRRIIRLEKWCNLKASLRHWFLAPFGRLRKPRPLEWDAIWEGCEIPICPHCGRVPYSLKACYFCGQRFTEEE